MPSVDTTQTLHDVRLEDGRDATWALTPAQTDGLDRIVCGRRDGAMVPIGTISCSPPCPYRAAQVFAHEACGDQL